MESVKEKKVRVEKHKLGDESGLAAGSGSDDSTGFGCGTASGSGHSPLLHCSKKNGTRGSGAGWAYGAGLESKNGYG